MKKILGLDLGTTSIGWALVNEAEKEDEKSSIIKIGVRVNPLSADEKSNFEKGKSITTNADRTQKRGMRRNLQRYKSRREELKNLLIDNHFIESDTVLSEDGYGTTHETLRLRAKAATEQISLHEFARVLLAINKKRGYKSNRKTDSKEEGQAVDGLDIARILFKRNLTPGQFVYERIQNGLWGIPEFYRSDLDKELNSIWDFQSQFYPDIMTRELREAVKNKNKTQTWAILQKPFSLQGGKSIYKGKELLKVNYERRSTAATRKLEPEELANVLQDINGQISASSGYLGAIGDRSKQLFFNDMTVGQLQWAEIQADRHHSLKNEVFYRQDYIDEFERIWETQAAYCTALTPGLKKEFFDTLFFQRHLKSQKNLISICELENRTITFYQDGQEKKKNIGLKVAPKSSPVFQEFKIWQILNNIRINGCPLELDMKQALAKELTIREKMSDSEVLRFLFGHTNGLKINFKSIEGNRTQAKLFSAVKQILYESGHEPEFDKLNYDRAMDAVKRILSVLGIKTGFLEFDSSKEGKELENQPNYQLWHLLYSYQGDNSKTGDESLVEKISTLCGLPKEYARILANVTFLEDYGSLSTKAMRKILAYMKEGNDYSEAVSLAYDYKKRHSKSSLTREELENKVYKDRLEPLPKNSLRNPVVEKILNQMVNVVNQVIETYGKPDEIRLELARELKKSAQEREELVVSITKNTKEQEEIKAILADKFGITNPSRNDITRYRLYKELEKQKYLTLYSGTHIQEQDIFSNKFDIEHIIPQARLFDDSFSNKTLELRDVNIKKGKETAADFVRAEYGTERFEEYKARVEDLVKSGSISRTKAKKLLWRASEIPDDFINRELRDSQYIAKKAKSMLEELVMFVVSTTGSVTDRLRQDWQLVDVMKELNWNKYDKVGKTEIITHDDGRRTKVIQDWTKRNDHRHHAMDALTIAFTKRSYIQYLNNLNARMDKSADEKELTLFHLEDYDLSRIHPTERSKAVKAIQDKEMIKDRDNKYRFRSPILPVEDFRKEAKKQLENVLVSFKSKTKVMTKNVNITKTGNGVLKKVQLTPRGQLHNETVYGSHQSIITKEEKIGPAFDSGKIERVASPVYRKALSERLEAFGGDPKKAFSGRNSLERNPVYLDKSHLKTVPAKVKTLYFETQYTIRKEINKDLKVEKVIDAGIRTILQKRLEEYGGKADKAFSNLDENPIWLNKEKGICIKRVSISGVNVATAIHDKRNKDGKVMRNACGDVLAADYVSTGNNHHIAIYRDAEGNFQEYPVSFFEATMRVSQDLPAVDRWYKRDEGWTFQFSMKRNEYFILPDNDFSPEDYDLLDPVNYSKISLRLFRVQKLSTKSYVFRHHLETSVEEDNSLRGITWERITNLKKLEGLVKVRVNHLGQIIDIGEY